MSNQSQPYQFASALRPVEWSHAGGRNGELTALVRLLKFGDKNHPDIWYRVVTCHDWESERELIGYCRDLESAGRLAHDYSCAIDSWQHERTGKRNDDPAWQSPPNAADLVRAYRAAERGEGRRP